MSVFSNVKQGILGQLPVKFQTMFRFVNFEDLQEIRFRLSRPVMLYYGSGYRFIRPDGILQSSSNGAYIAAKTDLDNLVSAFCNNSVYAYRQEIQKGFLTINGGHRVGLCGRGVLTDGQIENLSHISGVNIRIAKEFPGCSTPLTEHIVKGGRVQNTLIISPPQCGKTTMLRDIARHLSQTHKITIVDERSELAASKNGKCQFDVGLQTDVLDGVPKAEGMFMSIRALSPDIIITDEIGMKEDVQAICAALSAGCKIITSIHGYDIETLSGSKGELLKLFETAIVLSRREGPGTIEAIETIKQLGEDLC